MKCYELPGNSISKSKSLDGTGLGLVIAIARAIVAGQEGSIEVTSLPANRIPFYSVKDGIW